MPTPLSGPGVGLPAPQALYPSVLNNSPFTSPTNEVMLQPGGALTIPAGTWFVDGGLYANVQWVDPVTGLWRNHSSARKQVQYVKSDGFNVRLFNPTGCPMAAVVTTAGSNYVQATTTVTVNAGNSTWQPIVGGLISVTTSVVSAGSGYGIPPLVHIAAPANPGVQATAYAILSSGTISSISVTNQGAGYLSVPNVVIQPNPNDPNYIAGSVVNGSATVALTGSGTLAAVLCTDPGTPLTVTPTMTVAGAGTSAAASVVMCWSITGATIAGAGAGYNTANQIISVNGVTGAVPTHTNPVIEQTAYCPRPAMIGTVLNGTSIGSIGTIYDGGMFSGIPQAVVLAGGANPTTVASISGFNVGGNNATIVMQPAP